MRVERRVFPPFIAKRVEGIFGYDILLYGFLFRRQWGSFSRSFARIGLLFIKWRRVEHKAARARTFLVRLARSVSCAAVYKLRFTLEKREIVYYAILCVNFVRELRYFTSKVAIFSLSALVRKVPGDARRAARGRRKSGEERGRGRVTKGEVVVVASINKINNPVNMRLNLCSLQ